MTMASNWRMAAIAAATILPLANARAEVTMEELLQRLEEQEQKILVLERRLEIQDEAAKTAKETAPVVSAGPRGFSLRSADGKNQLKFRGLIHIDGRYLNGEDPTGFTDSWQATRAKRSGCHSRTAIARVRPAT